MGRTLFRVHDTLTCWVLAADVLDDCRILERSLSGVARKFKPHITLRGRFRADLSEERNLARLLLEAERFVPHLVQLSPPVSVNLDMIWLECLPGNLGHAQLCQAHRVLDNNLRDQGLIREDLTPPHFNRDGFRPHITLKWGRNIGEWEKLNMPESVRLKNLSMYCYEDTPWSGKVTRIPLPSDWLGRDL